MTTRLLMLFPLLGAFACGKDPVDKATEAVNDYKTKAKETEAKLNLNMLSKQLKAYYYEMAEFPAENAPLSPAASCCDGPNHRCAPSPDSFASATWKLLDFTIEDPFYYRYEYQVVDKTKDVIVRAVGDLDCDGTLATYELHVTVQGGNPTTGDLVADKAGE